MKRTRQFWRISRFMPWIGLTRDSGMNENDSHSVNLLEISDLLGVGKAVQSFFSDVVETAYIETMKSFKKNPKEMMKMSREGINVKMKRFGITVAEIKIKIGDEEDKI